MKSVKVNTKDFEEYCQKIAASYPRMTQNWTRMVYCFIQDKTELFFERLKIFKEEYDVWTPAAMYVLAEGKSGGVALMLMQLDTREEQSKVLDKLSGEGLRRLRPLPVSELELKIAAGEFLPRETLEREEREREIKRKMKNLYAPFVPPNLWDSIYSPPSKKQAEPAPGEQSDEDIEPLFKPTEQSDEQPVADVAAPPMPTREQVVNNLRGFFKANYTNDFYDTYIADKKRSDITNNYIHRIVVDSDKAGWMVPGYTMSRLQDALEQLTLYAPNPDVNDRYKTFRTSVKRLKNQ